MKVDICCIVKNEQKFIHEWADYHLNKAGIHHIWVYEDFGSNNHEDLLKDFGDRVTLTKMKDNDMDIKDSYNTQKQLELYSRFLKKAKKNNLCDWVLFTDIDEFLMFEDGYSINNLTEDFKDKTGVWLCWKMYGANGHIKSPSCGVLEAYTKPCSIAEKSDRINKWNIKSLVNVKLADYFDTLHEIHGGILTNGGHYLDGLTYEKAWLNHYYSKSWEDYLYRIFSRGNMSNDYRTLDGFFRTNEDMLSIKKQLIDSVRFMHAKDTMWLSKDLKIISGGNVNKLKELKNKIR